jgi:ABC-type branched-subunit amino acid transport system substrate-binding protein
MSKTMWRVLAALLALTLVAAACSSDDSGSGGGGDDDEAASEEVTDAQLDYTELGLWDDGPCDESLEPLKIGLMTVFESPVLSLEDQAIALEASAEAFNARGGANGACIEVTTCDDGGNADQALGCVDTIDQAGVVATVNDQGTAGQADVSAAMADAGIPRVASNVVSEDWGDQNAYPLDASGTGVTFLLPQALINQDVSDIGLIRVDLAAASALVGLMSDLYGDEASFPYDVPVPAGTTDYTQFILGAQDAGVGGVTLALGENEAIQVVQAGQQLGTDLLIGSSLGSFPHSTVEELGDFADQMVFLWSFAPATTDIPVYQAMRQDLAASGEDSLQPANLKASPMRSWIGLYALLYMIRDAQMTDFTREGITQMLDAAQDVPMLGIFGDENWTPDLDHPGVFQRGGIDRWATYAWDPEAPATDSGLEGNFVETSVISFDETLCDSPFGGPC